jgi:hypothetical protein
VLRRAAAEGSTRRVSRLVLAVALAALCAGCSTLGRVGVAPPPPSEAATLTARAEQLARDGQSSAARDLFARVAGESTRDAVHARALRGLAQLQIDPRSGIRDYRAAHATFKRLLAEYPGGEWEAEARACDAILTDLFAREREVVAREREAVARDIEVARVRSEAAKTAADREAELTRLKSEAAKMAADLQRLKRIDLNLERRR